MVSNTTGDNNTAVGRNSLYENTTGYENVAVGHHALFANDSGFQNVAVGTYALYTNSIGGGNVALGSESLVSNVDGEANVSVGFGALYDNASGSLNVGLGVAALNNNTVGNYNVAIGAAALGANVSGESNTAVGYNSGAAAVGLSNTGAFGAGAQPTVSNTIRIGNSSITSIGGYAAWSNLSDARFKVDVRRNVPGLEFVKRLEPVTFKWDLDSLERFQGREPRESNGLSAAREEKQMHRYTGFLAQQVEAAAKECGYEFSGIIKPANERSHYELSYAEFVVPLVQAIQEQQKQIDELKAAARAHNSSEREKGVSLLGTTGDRGIFVLGLLALLFHIGRRLRPAAVQK
jgi:hypothetical protein